MAEVAAGLHREPRRRRARLCVGMHRRNASTTHTIITPSSSHHHVTPHQNSRFADTYFSQFQRLRNGKMQRLDPQDFGAGYRNVVGLPGGVDSPLFKVGGVCSMQRACVCAQSV